jgi:hypothetical protein
MKPGLHWLGLPALAFVACTATAQTDNWRITPYAWIAGFDGTAGLSSGGSGLSGRVDVDSGGLSDNIRLGGAMLHATWRRDRLTAFGDWTYANVKSDSSTPFGTLYAGVDAHVKGNIVEGYGGYELTGARDSHVDLFGGIRYYDLKIGLDLRSGTRPAFGLSGDRDWVDGVAGVRWDTRLANNWEAFASADIGAGGSDLSYQLFGGIGYRFGWGSIIGGWRHLHVDYEKSGFKLDAALTGPFFGASFQF